ncbi:MAG TPA: flagellar basal body rod protein FlgC [Anaeromyxobacteraceae bacterium]|nr:flagellar basal body rod protein FlgC [Anaeromyxobacteraceae bacterium]
MDFLSALNISASGLAAERVRVNLASSNLANAESTRGPDGTPYRRLDPVLEAVPFGDALSQANGSQPLGVRVAQVAQDAHAGRRVYDPSHPDSDPQGFVTLPNVNPIHEVVNLMSASRAYDANASAVETLKTMAQRALDIAR